MLTISGHFQPYCYTLFPESKFAQCRKRIRPEGKSIHLMTGTKYIFVLAYILYVLFPRLFCRTSLGIFEYKRARLVFLCASFLFQIYKFLLENGKGSVVDECGRSEPTNYIVDEEQFRIER
ncbi:hypothetical protein BDB00DRAFT_920083 [Zychaea mexicana]|uniref:uncharacterized protein n=1 Tax=Zychaea mexicana TaxID=64656 RepID=UPI0022FE032F|nr:uncharacterized protein BDB00DRAFT_920083 [Zychaea mexicana]KAI9489546.1 hypothetical protein BDB00DRAFT_920083 [Zychaea mexicana]